MLREAGIDTVRVGDIGYSTADDAAILAISPMISPLPSVPTVSCFLIFLKPIPARKHIKSICVMYSGHIGIMYIGKFY